MKNKKLIWVLAPAVLFIWGLIIYRVVKTVNGNDELIVSALGQPEAIQTAEMDTSTYVLRLDYEDPFLKKQKSVPPSSPASSGAVKKTQVRKPVVKKTVKKLPLKWPAITYLGIINGQQKDLCLLELDGASLFMVKGEVQSDLKLLEVYPDSVRLEFKKREKKTIYKNR